MVLKFAVKIVNNVVIARKKNQKVWILYLVKLKNVYFCGKLKLKNVNIQMFVKLKNVKLDI